MNFVDLSIQSVLKKSFEELKKYFLFYMVVAIIYCIIQAIIVSTSFLLFPMEFLKQGITKNIMTHQVNINLFFYLFLNIFFYVFNYLIFIGLAYQAYLVKKSAFRHWKQIFDIFSWQYMGKIFLGGLLYGAGVTLGLMLLIFPGIILALIWCLWSFIIFEGDFSAWQSLGESYRRTKGNELKIFLLLVITYSLGFLIFIPVFLLYIIGIISGIILSKILKNSLGFGIFDIHSIIPDRLQMLSEYYFGFVFMLPVIFYFASLGLFGKIFGILVLAEIYHRISITQKNQEIVELT